MTQQTVGLYQGEKVVRYYTTVKGGTAGETGGVDEEVLAYLKSILPKSMRRRIALDAGCGDCRWSEYLHRLGARRVIGLDNSPDMLALAAKRKVERDLGRLRLIRADMQEMPLLSESVDLVLASFSLMYFPALEHMIRAIARVLTSGGELYLATNLVTIDDSLLLKELKGKVIPIDLGTGGQTIPLENVVQPLEQYKSAFCAGGLVLDHEKYFDPEGLSVTPGYQHKEHIVLSKAVFKLSRG